MRAHLREHYTADGYEVWLVTEDRKLLVPGRTAGSEFTEDRSENRDDNSPSLFLRRDALEAIVAQGMNHVPPDVAQANHLADALGMRDRLLTMLEGHQLSGMAQEAATFTQGRLP